MRRRAVMRSPPDGAPAAGRRAWLMQPVVLVIVTSLYLSGALDFLELQLADARYRLVSRPASGEIVVVGIDGSSLQTLGVWPWPRSLHAELLDRLHEAGAAEVAFDVDFSSRSGEAQDRRLEEALQRWDGRAVLASFMQPTMTPGAFVFSEPLPRFAAHARLASVNVRPDQDGVVRRLVLGARDSGGRPIPSLAAALAGDAAAAAPEVFYVDYGIAAASVPRISYGAVLAGTFDPALVAGKRVVVGATAIELGDIVPVPVWRAMPGVMVQVLAAESLLQSRALQRPHHLVTIALVGLLVLGLTPLVARRSWRAGLVAVVAVIAGTNGAAIALQAVFPILLDTAPYGIAALLIYAAVTIGRTEQLSLRLLAERLALDRQSRLTRAIVENTFDALVTADDEGRILSFNPAAERLFGLRAAEARGQPFALLLERSGPSAGAEAPSLAALAEAGQPEEALARRRDSGLQPVDLAVTHTAGEPGIYIALIRDIGARKAAEALTSQAQQRLLDAIGSLSEGFALFDADDRLVLCNVEYRSLFPAAPELMQPGWRYEDILRGSIGDDEAVRVAGHESAFEAMLEQHRLPQGAYELQTASGRRLQIAERRTEEGGVAVLVSDITEMRHREAELMQAKEEAELASRSKTEFLANMSHELRTPLNAVIGFAEVMESQLFGPLGHDNYRTYTGDIRRSGEHLLGVINDILDMARIEAGKTVLNEEIVELGEAVDSAIRLIGQRAMASTLTIDAALDPDLPDLVADARLVKQCLINLLSNAVKFTPAGGHIAVLAKRLPDGLTVLVRDDGIGIAPEDMERVMAPFGQADGALARKYEGTGLGLPLVKSYMELHGGRLQLDSMPGRGTTASLVFPLERLRDRPDMARQA